MIARAVYTKTTIGGEGRFTYGGVASDDEGYSSYADQVAMLEQMEADGDIEILGRNRESMSGKRRVVSVRFKRLR